jgi:transcriptional regulator with XRE-family HTH domain
MEKKNTFTSIGQKIRRLRRERELGQAELAKKLNTSVVTISSYETDKSMPSSEMLIKLSKVFNVSIDYLVSAQTTGTIQVQNKELLKRVELLDRVKPEDLKSLIDMMDLVIRNQQVKDLAKAS